MAENNKTEQKEEELYFDMNKINKSIFHWIVKYFRSTLQSYKFYFVN